MRTYLIPFLVCILFISIGSYAASKIIHVPMFLLEDKNHQKIGEITLKDGNHGLVLIIHLSHLPPGEHGFHVHERASCNDKGMAAGAHLDPKKSNKHLGPYMSGHLGDLPRLNVDANGNADALIIAPRMKLSDVKGKSLIIHKGGDNYSDQPEKLGGGGQRIACGLIK